MSDTVLQRTTHISFPDLEDTKNHDITIGIASGSLSLDEILLSKNLNFGEYNSNKFEVQLYNIADVSGQKIVVWQTEGGSEDKIPLFTGYVDSCKQDTFGLYRNIVAYDVLYLKGSTNIASWWTDFWEEKGSYVSLKDLRTSLLEFMGIETADLPEGGLLNDDLLLSSGADLATLRFSDVLKNICELQCTFPNIDREGKLEFISLGTEAKDVSANIDVGGSAFEEYTTEGIDAVWLYDASPVVVGVGGDASEPKNAYKIQGNFIAYGIQTKLFDTAAKNIYEAVKGYTYVPGELEFIISDLSLHLGDKLKFADGKYTYVLENDLSGPLLIEQEIRASGDRYIQKQSSTQTSYLELKKQVEASQFYLRTFTNKKAVEAGDDATALLLSFRLSTAKQSMLVFNAEVPIELTFSSGSTKAVVTVSYTWNDTSIPYTPIETFYGESKDKHTIHLFYPIPSSESTSLAWMVYIKAKGASLNIPAQGLQASVFGEGMSMSVNLWDGTITVEDSIKPITLPKITVGKINDNVVFNFLNPTKVTPSDTITPIQLMSIQVGRITDNLGVNEPTTNKWVDYSAASDMTYNTAYVKLDKDKRFVLNTDYTSSGVTDEGADLYIDSVNLYKDGVTTESVTV